MRINWHKQSKNDELYESIGFWVFTLFWIFLAIYTPDKVTPDAVAKGLWYAMAVCLFLMGALSLKSWSKNRNSKGS